MIHQSLLDDCDGLEPSMRMHGKAGNLVAVVHAKTIPHLEIHADVATRQRRRGAEAAIAARETIVVVGTKQEGVESRPVKGERQNVEYGHAHLDAIQKCTVDRYSNPTASMV